MAAVHVVRWARGREVQVAELVIGAHRGPDVASADVAPRLVLVGLNPRLTLARNHAEDPAQFPCSHIEGANLAGGPALPGRRVLLGHRATHHDQVAHDERRRVPGVLPVDAQIDATPLAERRNGIARLRVKGIEMLLVVGEDAPVRSVLPISDGAQGPAQPGVPGEVAVGFLAPYRPARLGIERLGQPDGVGRVQHAAGHDRRRAIVVRQTQVGRRSRKVGVDLGAPPRDSQMGNVGAIDLFERRVLRRSQVARVVPPFAFGRAVVGGAGERGVREKRERQLANPGAPLSRHVANPPAPPNVQVRGSSAGPSWTSGSSRARAHQRGSPSCRSCPRGTHIRTPRRRSASRESSASRASSRSRDRSS